MYIKSISIVVCSLLAIQQVAANQGYQSAEAPPKQQNSYGVDINQYIEQFGAFPKQFGFDSSKSMEFLNGLYRANGKQQDGAQSVSEADFFAQVQKLMNNPAALTDYISTTFRLPADQLKQILERDEVLSQDGHPIAKSAKILERVFVPNECRLKILCQVGLQFGMLREPISRIPSQWFEGSGYYKALNQGVGGEDCLVAYTKCKQGDELVLANPFASLRLYGGEYGGQSQYEQQPSTSKPALAQYLPAIKQLPTQSAPSKSSISLDSLSSKTASIQGSVSETLGNRLGIQETRG